MKESLIHLPFVLTTRRVILQRYFEGDGLCVFKLVQDNRDRLAENFPITVAAVADETKAELFVRDKIVEWYAGQAYSFGIWERHTDHYIGHAIVKNVDWTIPKAELAYYLDKQYEGKGLMTEAMQALIRFCFEELKLMKVFLRVLPENHRSYKMAERCGFIREGMLRNEFRGKNGHLHDIIYYGMTVVHYGEVKENFTDMDQGGEFESLRV